MVDSKGLITSTRGDKLPAHKQPFARTDGTPDMKDLKEILAYVKPHALFGLSGAGPSFFQVDRVCLCRLNLFDGQPSPPMSCSTRNQQLG